MARSDYERPAWYQINREYECRNGHRQSVRAGESAQMPCWCGAFVNHVGESYPGDANDWDLERDSLYSPWRQKR